MEIEIRDEKKQDYILQVGDIVKSPRNIGMVIELSFDDNKGRYVIRFINKDSWFNGTFPTLEDLTRSVYSAGYAIYPKSEYKLVLERK